MAGEASIGCTPVVTSSPSDEASGELEGLLDVPMLGLNVAASTRRGQVGLSDSTVELVLDLGGLLAELGDLGDSGKALDALLDVEDVGMGGA